MFSHIDDDDIPAVVALMNRAYRGHGASAGWSTETGYIAGDRTTEALVRADLRDKKDAALLKWEAVPGAALRACVWLEPVGDGIWYLGSLAIDPDQQNSGLGRVVLAAAEDWARQRGATRIRMSVVNVRDALIAWYGRRGYERTGETTPFPYDDTRFGTPLRDDLAFVILEKDLMTAGVAAAAELPNAVPQC